MVGLKKSDIAVIMSALAIITSIYSVYLASSLDIKLAQHQSMSEIQNEMAEISLVHKILIVELVDKYGFENVQE